jgi:hypothetical protein
MARDIECIFTGAAKRSLFCFAEEIRALKRRTLRRQSYLRKNGANNMAEKLTPYDPAEDLVSDEGIALFMAEAFKTQDAAFIAHALGIVAR